jgi:hypothetical protein
MLDGDSVVGVWAGPIEERRLAFRGLQNGYIWSGVCVGPPIINNASADGHMGSKSMHALQEDCTKSVHWDSTALPPRAIL